MIGEAAARAVDGISAACPRSSTAVELFADVSRQLAKIVPFDGATWFGIDPDTLLATRPARIENVEAGHCAVFWEREFLVDDANLFVDMARHGRVASGLREVTADRPALSARYREFLAPQGYDDELRVLFRVGRSTWGVAGLFRAKGRPAFCSQETNLVAGLSRPMATALRRHLLAGTVRANGEPASPGLLCLDRAGALVTCNEDARVWLTELTEDLPDLCEVPLPVRTVAAQAQAIRDGRTPGRARLRVQGRNGRWLLMHGSTLTDGTTAVIIEPARTAEIASIIVEAYALSEREQEVVQQLARGATTTQIASRLVLSTHTVRDHIKAVFAKTGVSSRSELIVKLFAEHYGPDLHAEPAHAET